MLYLPVCVFFTFDSGYLPLLEQVIMGRLGRWIDFKNDYKTMYPSFMESIWWVFKQLYDKGLVYRGFKVMLLFPNASFLVFFYFLS